MFNVVRIEQQQVVQIEQQPMLYIIKFLFSFNRKGLFFIYKIISFVDKWIIT